MLASSGPVLKAGLLYFTIVFGCGFVLGVLRVSMLVPMLGELAATVIEAPVMLAISWVVVRRVIERVGIGARLGPRLLMGGIAFGLLMMAEAALALGFGRTLAEHVAAYRQSPQFVGLAAQVGFALIPALQFWFRSIANHERPLK